VHDRNFGHEYRDEKNDGKDAIRDRAPFVTTNIQRPVNVCHVEPTHGPSSCVAMRSSRRTSKRCQASAIAAAVASVRIIASYRTAANARQTSGDDDLFRFFELMTKSCNLFV
jgi:hypothetical protein